MIFTAAPLRSFENLIFEGTFQFRRDQSLILTLARAGDRSLAFQEASSEVLSGFTEISLSMA